MELYLPIAGNSINILLMIGLGASVGLLSGMFGVGGGFLMTPLLMMFGIPATVAAATDSNQIVAASASACYAHFRAKTVDIRMGLLMLVGGVVGGTLGVGLIKLLRRLGEADFVITAVYVLVLGGIGSYMFYESLTALRGRRPVAATGKPSTYRRVVESLPFKAYFPRSKVTVSALMPFALGVLVGVLAAIMGVGGGFTMLPVMIYLLRMPMHVAIGTSLFQILFTCINVTVLQSHMNHTVDFLLALLLLLGSVLGAQVGVRIGRGLKADQLKILLALVVLAVMVKMLLGLLLQPDFLLAYKGGH